MSILDEAVLDAKTIKEAAEKRALDELLQTKMPQIKEFIEKMLNEDDEETDDLDEESKKMLLHDDELDENSEEEMCPAENNVEQSGEDNSYQHKDGDKNEPVFSVEVDYNDDELVKENKAGGKNTMGSELYKLLEADYKDEEESVDEMTDVEDLDAASVDEGGLEDEVPSDEPVVDVEEEPEEGEVTAEASDKEEVDEWVEIDEAELEQALKEMGGEDEDEEVDEGVNSPFDGKPKVGLEGDVLALKESVKKLSRQNKELASAVNKFHKQLQESNLFSAKLLYASKVMNRSDISSADKKSIVETFDKAQTIREVRLLFETYTKTLNNSKVQSRINESTVKAPAAGGSSKVAKSGGASSLNENADLSRWRQLAGLKQND